MSYEESLDAAAAAIRGEGGVIAVGAHEDSDGVMSAAIAVEALIAGKKRFVAVGADAFTRAFADRIAAIGPSLVWLVDMGGGEGSLDLVGEKFLDRGVRVVITDHHPTIDLRHGLLHQLNPNLFGIDGDLDVSGATATYLLAKRLVDDPAPLARFAVVGSVGDRQLDGEGKLTGVNREVLAEAEKAGHVAVDIGLQIFGRSSRSMLYALAYGTSFYITNFSENTEAVLNYLGSWGIRAKTPAGEWRRLCDLDENERETLNEKLIMLMIERGIPREQIHEHFAELYHLPKERQDTPMAYADEYATLLNAVSRSGRRWDVALGIVLGSADAYAESEQLLEAHRENIKSAIEYIRANPDALVKLPHLYYVVLPEDVPWSIAGNVASVIGSSDIIEFDRGILTFGMDAEGGKYKLSLRLPDEVAEKVSAGDIMRWCGEQYGLGGGGHAAAAGGAIPISVSPEDVAKAMDGKIGAAS